RASKVRPRTLASSWAWQPAIAPERSRVRRRRWHGETLRRTRAAYSVRGRRPSAWSSASIFRSTSSTEKILPSIADYRGKLETHSAQFGLGFPFASRVPGPAGVRKGGGMAVGTLAAFWAVSFLLVLVPGAGWAYLTAAGLRAPS